MGIHKASTAPTVAMTSPLRLRCTIVVVAVALIVVPPIMADDRSNQAATASAITAAGAMMAGVACAKLLKDAQEVEDPAMKALLENQAMQQCQQATENAANAVKNSGAKDATRDTTPTVPELGSTTPTPKSSDSPQGPLLVQTPDQSTPSSEPNRQGSQIADDNTNLPDPLKPPSAFDASTLSRIDYTGTGASDPGDTPISKSTLDPIASQTVGYGNADNIGPALSAVPSTMSTLSASGGTRQPAQPDTASAADLRQLASELSESKSGRHAGQDIYGESSSDASGQGSAAGKHADGGFASMLSNIMGGPKSELALTTQAGAFDNGVKLVKNKTAAPNIFEYASYRYHKLSNEQTIAGSGQLRKRAQK